ncbi:1,2-oxophytodienoate reductase [Tatumella morbirosei]|uniref:1,2-oxophytodienoate reductase n=1 Tax=Tatumella morbirosei TaxID=642227 RepID=A0A095T6D4_9GAMM|nr:12-oxophytodienoate reductase [Tatumella morbirosei]KGD72481.1 1,2-oxophytodienoate reductase [Tatumella morbirosei]
MNTESLLFKPYSLKKLLLPNRVVMAPMTRSFAPQGIPTPEMAAYYTRRAAAGVGLIITEATGINRPLSVNEPDVPVFYGDALAGWKKIVDDVHSAGGKIMPQLWHVGTKQSIFHRDWQSASAYQGPSGLSVSGEQVSLPMSDKDIADTIDAFASAAQDAAKLGFDGIELHGGHSYLINQFFFEHLNLRKDQWGGKSLLERSRFAIEVIRAIRKRTGPDFPILFRFSQWKAQAFDSRIAETPAVLQSWLEALVNAGVDIFDCSQRHYWDAAFPEVDRNLNMAGWVKKLTGVPSIAVGAVGLSGDVFSSLQGKRFAPASLDELLERLENDEFDLVMVGRPLLQDPLWLQKIRLKQYDQLEGFDNASLRRLY